MSQIVHHYTQEKTRNGTSSLQKALEAPKKSQILVHLKLSLVVVIFNLTYFFD